jgi:hypothetical protein
MSEARIEIKTKYNEREFINYAKKNIKDFIKNNRNSFLSRLFFARTNQREICKKKPFIIYWLLAEKSKFWVRENLKYLLEGKAELVKEDIDGTLNVFEKLLEEPVIEYFFGEQYYEYNDIRRIVYRYQKERKALVERKLLELIKRSPNISGTTGKIAFNFSSSLSEYTSEKIIQNILDLKKYYEIKFDLLEYIKSEGIVIQSEIRRRKRMFRRIDKALFKKIVSELEAEGRISIKIYSGRTFLNYND